VTKEQPSQAQLEKQANAAVEQVKDMCRRAFNEGVRQGYGNGFAAGVAAASDIPMVPPRSDA
jgi:flagellar biosynthesis/type III secretory pathway protein FliH